MKDLKLPFAVDRKTGEPSVTLLFAYVAFIIACTVITYLSYKDITAGSIGALTLFFGSLVFYRLRRLDRVKFNLDEKSFELESSEDKKDEK